MQKRQTLMVGIVLTTLLMVVTIHTMRSAELIRQLMKEGWTLDRVVGSHHIFKHPTKLGHISVPHPKADLGKGLIHKLLKLAGLK
jgi:predicted RNA binding protein YcfA (HicA-like mRNA interferase family)